MKRISCILLLVMLISLLCPITVQAAGAFSYTDPLTGASFIVPAGWKAISEEGDGAKLTVRRPKDTRIRIMYDSEDLWESTDNRERGVRSRAKMDNEYLEKHQGISAPLVSFGGLEYYLIEEPDGTGCTFLRLNNGYCYRFVLTAPGRTAYQDAYGDLAYMLRGANYPNDKSEENISFDFSAISADIANILYLVLLIGIFVIRRLVKAKRSSGRTGHRAWNASAPARGAGTRRTDAVVMTRTSTDRANMKRCPACGMVQTSENKHCCLCDTRL